MDTGLIWDFWNPDNPDKKDLRNALTVEVLCSNIESWKVLFLNQLLRSGDRSEAGRLGVGACEATRREKNSGGRRGRRI